MARLRRAPSYLQKHGRPRVPEDQIAPADGCSRGTATEVRT